MNSAYTLNKTYSIFCWLTLAALTFFYPLLLWIDYLYFSNSTAEARLTSPEFYYELLDLFESMVLWLALAYTFKLRLASALAFVISSGWSVVIYLNSTDTNLSQPFWVYPSFQIFAYCIFGIMALRSYKGLYFLIIPLCFSGIEMALRSDFLMQIVQSMGIDSSIKTNTTSSSYVKYDFLNPLFRMLLLPLSYLIISYFLVAARNSKRAFFTLTDISIIPPITRLQYSVIYWVSRSIFTVVSLGVFQLISSMYRARYLSGSFSEIFSIYALVVHVLGLYVCVSIYRNFILAYFIEKERHLKWEYILLNVPVVNFFAWLSSVMNVNNKKVSQAELASDGYSALAYNILLTMLGLSALVSVVRGGFSMDAALVATVLKLTISFVLFVMFTRLRYMLHALIFLALAYLLYLNQYPMEIPSRGVLFHWVVNFIILYPIFHFSEFKISRAGTA